MELRLLLTTLATAVLCLNFGEVKSIGCEYRFCGKSCFHLQGRDNLACQHTNSNCYCSVYTHGSGGSSGGGGGGGSNTGQETYESEYRRAHYEYQSGLTTLEIVGTIIFVLILLACIGGCILCCCKGRCCCQKRNTGTEAGGTIYKPSPYAYPNQLDAAWQQPAYNPGYGNFYGTQP